MLKDMIVLCRRWHADVRGCQRATWLTCKATHTLLAGVAYRGALGSTRAQTVQVLGNSLALELVVLCMQFDASPPASDVAIDPVYLAASGLIAAAITIPGMSVFALARRILSHPSPSSAALL